MRFLYTTPWEASRSKRKVGKTMPNNKVQYLTMEQINILLKCYYLRTATKVALEENLKPSQVRVRKEHALRNIRLAYSRSYLNGKRFSGETVLKDMAERSCINLADLTRIFEGYVSEGFTSENRRFWERIICKKEKPTPAELLDFLYSKYEIEIEGFI